MDGFAPDAWAALAATSASIVVTDARQPGNPICYANAAFSALCGYSHAEVIGRNCRFLQGPDTDRHVCAEIRTAVADGVSIRRELLNYRKDGTTFWNDLRIDPIHDETGRLVGFVSSQYEAGAARKANDALADAEARLNNIAAHVPGYIFRRVMRRDGTIDVAYCSPSLGIMLGIDDRDASRSFYNYVHPDDRAALFAAIRSSAAKMSIFREEFRLVSPSGKVHWMRSDAPPRRMVNGEVVWDGLAIEISVEKHWQGEIANLALHDPLTGLLNREAWRQALAMRLNTDDGQGWGLLYVDIVAFYDINEKYGQKLADDVLREVARRLTRIAASVAGVAARLGGDEFAILVASCSGDDALAQLANVSSEALARPLQVEARRLAVRTCIGAAMFARPDAAAADNDVASELMTQAEIALRWAKQAGHSGYMLYSASKDDRFQNQAILARSLERAIADGELELHYQPLVDLASGRIVSAEALVRWKHPTLGMQRPDLFIPLAETSGLIVPLGRWVLEQAIRQRGLWRDGGLAPPRIAINVSGKQLIETGFVQQVADAMARWQADARDFEIELTEGQLIEASPHIMTSLHALRDMGFTITIDDFGSGHATFRYLRDFPVDKVKIDQMFVRKLVLESNDALIIRAIIALARTMGIGLVAEGIETEMQRNFLQREGCRIGQGYFFSMPLVAEDFAWMLVNEVKLPLRIAAEPDAGGNDSGPRSDMGGQ